MEIILIIIGLVGILIASKYKLEEVDDKKIQVILKNNNRDVVIKELTSYLYPIGFTTNQNNTIENMIVFRREKVFNFGWALFWFAFFGVGILIYIFYWMSKRDEIINIDLSTKQNKQELGYQVENKYNSLEKIKRLYDDGILTLEEYTLEKNTILKNQ